MALTRPGRTMAIIPGTDTLVERIKGFILTTDQRALIPTSWNADNNPTHIDIKSDTTIVGTIDITYNNDGKVTQYVVTADGTTVTYTVTWDVDKWTGTSKVVN